MEDFKHLTAIYCKDVDVELAISEYKQLCDSYKATPGFADNPQDILQSMLIMIKEWDINNAYPNLPILYRMGTIAMSSATSKRSFSRLKLTKQKVHHGETTTQPTCATNSIEREFAENLDFDSVIDTFSQISVRRIKLK